MNCSNGGVLVEQSQLQYLCIPIGSRNESEIFRVDQTTYQQIQNNYSYIFACEVANVT